MHWIVAMLTIISACSGALSTWYWFRSSQIQVQPSWAKEGGSEPVLPEISMTGWIVGLTEAGQKAAALNKLAATYTAIAIGSGTIANLLSILAG